MKIYSDIVKHYESCLEKHGDSHLGVDWPNLDDAQKRYQIMLDLVRPKEADGENISLLDFGCGTAHLYEYIQNKNLTNLTYTGLDFSEKFTEICEKKYPNVPFLTGDILDPDFKLGQFDYVVMNGVFTEKRELSFEQMWEYFKAMIAHTFKHAQKGIAFNVMSTNVDWERDDLFHLSLDKLTAFLCADLSRNFVIRNDYGLYEYTVYLYK